MIFRLATCSIEQTARRKGRCTICGCFGIWADEKWRKYEGLRVFWGEWKSIREIRCLTHFSRAKKEREFAEEIAHCETVYPVI